MSAVLQDPPKATPILPEVPAGQHSYLRPVRWQTYDLLCHDLDGQRIRLSFDRGELEIMTLSREHEIYKWFLARFIELLAEEWNLAFDIGGSMTFRREDIERGLEPDECYWFQSAGRIRGKRELDFRTDPPPDLVVEIEVTQTLVNRLGILAALGVPEVWRFNGTQLLIGQLQPSGTYVWGDPSRVFPGLSAAELGELVKQAVDTDRGAALRRFRQWAREQAAKKKPTKS
jgi:Uma2 family endonuclease